MNDNNKQKFEGWLKESDYLWVLDVVTELQSSNAMSDLEQIILERILPVFRSKSMIYGWTDREITRVSLVSGVGIPEETLPVLEKFIPYDPVAPAIIKNHRPVMGYDIDFSRDEVPRYLNNFIKDNPEINKTNHPYLFDLWGGITTINLPEANLGLSIHRLGFDKTPITPKDIRLLSLLGPHLLSSISEQLVRDELSMHKTISQKLIDSVNPIAIFDGEYRINFQNKSFQNLFCLASGHFFSEKLRSALKNDLEDKNVRSVDCLEIQQKYFKFKGTQYQFRVYQLNIEVRPRNQRFLVRMKPVSEPASKTSFLFAKIGLTPREKEICLLIKSKKSDSEICLNLGIKPATLETHLKNIFKKFNVGSRANLISSLFT